MIAIVALYVHDHFCFPLSFCCCYYIYYVCLFCFHIEWHREKERECVRTTVFVNWLRNLVSIVCRLCVLFCGFSSFFFFRLSFLLRPPSHSFTACCLFEILSCLLIFFLFELVFGHSRTHKTRICQMSHFSSSYYCCFRRPFDDLSLLFRFALIFGFWIAFAFFTHVYMRVRKKFTKRTNCYFYSSFCPF